MLTLGSATMFGFDGANVTPGTAPASSLAAADDVVLAEPGGGAPTLAATAGVAIAPVLASFGDSDASATPASFSASIDWGDGSRRGGTISRGSGAEFVLSGTHAYAQAGSYMAKVTVDDFSAKRKIAILVMIVAGAILTPTQDPLSMFALAAPMILLYEVGILLIGRQKARVPSMAD